MATVPESVLHGVALILANYLGPALTPEVLRRALEHALNPSAGGSSDAGARGMSVADAAALLRVSERGVWRLLQRQVLPRVKVGGVTRIPDTAVLGLMLRQTTKPKPAINQTAKPAADKHPEDDNADGFV